MRDGRSSQYADRIVCQVCGRSALLGTPHWLNQPHRDFWDIQVQRCPRHWTDWALRNTREGRTNNNRALMAEALQQPVSEAHPYIEPWATTPLDPNASDEDQLPIEDTGGDRGFSVLNKRKAALRLIRLRREQANASVSHDPNGP